MNLANPLAFYVEFFSDLLVGVVLAIPHSGTHPENVGCARNQIGQLGLTESVERHSWEALAVHQLELGDPKATVRLRESAATLLKP